MFGTLSVIKLGSECFEFDCYMVTKDGSLKFSIGYTNRDYMVSWVLGFGDKARVIDPIDLVNEIKDKAKNIILNYEHDI